MLTAGASYLTNIAKQSIYQLGEYGPPFLWTASCVEYGEVSARGMWRSSSSSRLYHFRTGFALIWSRRERRLSASSKTMQRSLKLSLLDVVVFRSFGGKGLTEPVISSSLLLIPCRE